MRLMMLLGGLIGFLIGLCMGAVNGGSMAEIFWKASVAACLAGIALRWWGKVWISSLQKELQNRTNVPEQAKV